MSVVHFVLRSTRRSNDVGGRMWLNIAGSCKVLVMSSDPMVVSLWCAHNIWMARCFVLGSILGFAGIVGSL